MIRGHMVPGSKAKERMDAGKPIKKPIAGKIIMLIILMLVVMGATFGIMWLIRANMV